MAREKKTGLQCQGWDGPCENQNAKKIRMRTAYAKDGSNLRMLCPECQKSCSEYWDEMWKEYYADCTYWSKEAESCEK